MSDALARLRGALDPLPDGALVPVAWVRALVQDCGGQEAVDLTVEEAGRLLHRAPSTMRTWCARGHIPGAYRLAGREWRIPRAALQALGEGSGPQRTGDTSRPADLGSWRRERAS